MEQLLQIESFGAKLRVKDGLLEVTTPDLTGAGKHIVRSFAAQNIKTILLNRQTSASTDALLLGQKHEVDIFITGDFGIPEAYIAPLSAPPYVQLLQKQLSLVGTLDGLSIARHWLVLKVERKIEWLGKLRSYRTGEARQLIEQTVRELRDLYARLKQLPLRKWPDDADTLRGMEGAGHRLYLDTLSKLLPASLQFDGRSRRPAADLFNAALNYAYGYLYRWVEKAIWMAGLSPYVGYLHTNGRKQKALLYDLIEAFRPWADSVVFKLFSSREINGQHAKKHRGGFWLNDEGCKLLGNALVRSFTKPKFRYHGKLWTLRQAFLLEARRLRVLLRRLINGEPLPPWAAADMQCSDPDSGAVCAVCFDKFEV